jgi:phage tail-like protein
MVERQNKNPYGAFNFVVLIDGQEVAAFQEVSGLDTENMPIEYRDEFDKTNNVRKLPGLEKYQNLMLRRGISGSPYPWQWRKEVRDSTGQFPPVRNVTIQLQNERREAVYSWKLLNAWCCKLSGPSLNAKSNEIAIETMELAYDRIESID